MAEFLKMFRATNCTYVTVVHTSGLYSVTYDLLLLVRESDESVTGFYKLIIVLNIYSYKMAVLQHSPTQFAVL